MKKNCTNCKHLEWVDGDDGGFGNSANSGFDCDKRHDDMAHKGREDELLKNLDRDSYREKSKRCCDLKPEGEIITEITCSTCGTGFTGYKRDEGTECFDCYSAKYFQERDND